MNRWSRTSFRKDEGAERNGTRPGGQVAFPVWGYSSGGMGFIDAFWTAARKVGPAAAELDESAGFPFCTRDGVIAMCRKAGLAAEVAAIEVQTEFRDFDDLWTLFTLGAGPAPGYFGTLNDMQRTAFRDALKNVVGDTGGAIALPARAWAARVGI